MQHNKYQSSNAKVSLDDDELKESSDAFIFNNINKMAETNPLNGILDASGNENVIDKIVFYRSVADQSDHDTESIYGN